MTFPSEKAFEYLRVENESGVDKGKDPKGLNPLKSIFKIVFFSFFQNFSQ